MAKSRQELMQDEIVRLDHEVATLEREWRRLPWLFTFIFSALPAYWLWGPVAAVYAVLFTPLLVATAVYLVGTRRREAKHLRAELARQVGVAPGGAGTPPE